MEQEVKIGVNNAKRRIVTQVKLENDVLNDKLTQREDRIVTLTQDNKKLCEERKALTEKLCRSE